MISSTLANKHIFDSIEAGSQFTLGRLGLSEISLVYWYLTGGLESSCQGDGCPTLGNRLEENGIYGNCGNDFFKEYIEGIKASDLQVEWNGFGLEKHEEFVLDECSPDSLKISAESLDPYRHPDFWSKALAGKKVLIVHAFEGTIISQYVSHRDLLWSDEHARKLPNFDMQIYKPYWVMGKEKPHGSWLETFEAMKKDISVIDFDICLMACSHFGMPLLAHINQMGKSAIYMGGTLQLLFGIKGWRWDDKPEVNKYYNKFWTWPLDDKPDNYQVLDGGCYWQK